MRSKGICKACNKAFSGSGMTRHLQACVERKKLQLVQGRGRILLLKASAGPFWVYFDVGDSSTLADVDSFLRALWLECCGHLSAFTIGSVTYTSDTGFMDSGEKSMNIALKKVIKPGVKFRHEYDFGTTTELDIECISERQGRAGTKIDIIARNDMPEILCNECGKPAEEICTECMWDGEGFLCESCAEDHECGEEMLLPVVNSPRMGMCAYAG